MVWENPYTLGGGSPHRDYWRVPWWDVAWPPGHRLVQLTTATTTTDRTGMVPGTTEVTQVTYVCECGTSWTDTRHAPPPDHHVRERFGDHTRQRTGQRPQLVPAYGPGTYPDRSTR